LTQRHYLQEHRDDVLLVLLGLAVVVTFLADALGWFRNGWPFR
jgi:hypothetical protein